MLNLTQLLSERKIVFLDGGMGTQLQARGLQPGEIPEEWNLRRPDDVQAVHAAYNAAGSDIVVTNTFGANPAKCHGEAPLADYAAQICATSYAKDAMATVRVAEEVFT